MQTNWKLGSELTPAQQRTVLNRFVNRYTGDHVPGWARRDGNKFVQFSSDVEWLAKTRFAVNKDGRLSQRVPYCDSKITWPNNPELRSNKVIHAMIGN